MLGDRWFRRSNARKPTGIKTRTANSTADRKNDGWRREDIRGNRDTVILRWRRWRVVGFHSILPSMNFRDMTLRHPFFVRATHWLTTIAFVALLVTGVEVLLSHPRFYWGETGNVNETPILVLPVPSSRSSVPTGWNVLLDDQNGWSRLLHFQSAWLLAVVGAVYLGLGLMRGHLRRELVPDPEQRQWRALRHEFIEHLRFSAAAAGDGARYVAIQRATYLLVIFGMVPAVVWTGLAMSPGVAAISPVFVDVLGGKQTARTLHFAVSIVLTLFVLVHVAMIARGGFVARVRAMLTGELGNAR
jgi:thiosulfate reductase cytochrome b subunit